MPADVTVGGPDDLHVMVVEDDPNDGYLVQHAFTVAAAGVDVTILTSGEAACAYLEEAGVGGHPLPDVVLMDIMLPGMSGLEVLGWMRQRETSAPVPVVVLTSSREPKEVLHAYHVGANAFVRKMSDIDRLERFAAGVLTYAALARDGDVDGASVGVGAG